MDCLACCMLCSASDAAGKKEHCRRNSGRHQYTRMLLRQQAFWGSISRPAMNFHRRGSGPPSSLRGTRTPTRGSRVLVCNSLFGKQARLLFDVVTPRFGSRKMVRLNRIRRLSGPHIEFRSPSATIRVRFPGNENSKIAENPTRFRCRVVSPSVSFRGGFWTAPFRQHPQTAPRRLRLAHCVLQTAAFRLRSSGSVLGSAKTEAVSLSRLADARVRNKRIAGTCLRSPLWAPLLIRVFPPT